MRIDIPDDVGPQLSTCGGAVDHLQRVGQEVLADACYMWPEGTGASPHQLAPLGRALSDMC